MADILVRGDQIYLNPGQVQAFIDNANRIYAEGWAQQEENWKHKIYDPYCNKFSGHCMDGRFPLTLEKLRKWYDEDNWKLYLDGWMGESLPQVCFIPGTYCDWVAPDGTVYYCISMDDGWVDYIRDRTISTLSQVFDKISE